MQFKIKDWKGIPREEWQNLFVILAIFIIVLLVAFGVFD